MFLETVALDGQKGEQIFSMEDPADSDIMKECPFDSKYIYLNNVSTLQVLNLKNKQFYVIDPQLPEGKQINAYKPFSIDKIVLITENKYVNIVKVDHLAKSHELICRTQLYRFLGRPEIFNQLSVCPYKNLIGIASNCPMGSLARVMFYKFKGNSVGMQTSLDYVNDKSRSFNALEINWSFKNKVVMSGFSKGKDSVFYIVVYNERSRKVMIVKRIKTDLNTPTVNTFNLRNGEIHGIDWNFNLFSVKI
jgi:hypothetical protein